MKKLLLILFTFHFSLSTLKAQGTWTPRDTLPNDTDAMVQGISGFSIENYGYAGLGQNARNNLTAFWQFDPSNNTWTRKADFPGTARIAPASFVIGDKAYLVTGSVRNAGPCVTECWEYDATSNTWAQKANFPGSARTYAVGFAIDSLGYVGTGANELSNFRKDFYAYHPSTNTWTSVADFGGTARSAASGFAVNGKGYVCFGQDSTIKYYGDMWEYDPVANSWNRKANIPPGDTLAPHAGASGFAICNNIYVGSGVDTLYRWSHEFWKFNTVTNTWTQQASPPGKTKIQGAAFAIGDSGYYGFGCDSTGRGDINVFDKFYAGDSCNKLDEGINLITQKIGIEIYPNPFQSTCFIKLPEEAQNYVPQFSLYSVDGRKMEATIGRSDNEYILNCAQLLQGVYVLSIKLGNQVMNKKIVLIK